MTALSAPTGKMAYPSKTDLQQQQRVPGMQAVPTEQQGVPANASRQDGQPVPVGKK
jgi:hypothetical protein